MLWATRVNGRRDAKAHQILDIKPDATLDEAQTAFHKIARIAHPDLHRTTLGPEDLESVTSAYSKAAAAYQEFRTQKTGTTRMRPIGKDVPGRPATSPGAAKPAGSTTAAGQMSSKALIYYRKAELALRRGDLTSAILQLKMAVAADPQSAFLRTALAEVEAEVAKTP
jgi:hypothetical protein